jgi:two-component system, chemotaxis family, protein-glutamate methylesterase/glutaminase
MASENTPDLQEKVSPPVVCIGMSTGGIAPLRKIFDSLEGCTGMAFVIIHHIHKPPSHLPEILRRDTRMPVETVAENVVLQPDHVYVLAPGQEATLRDGCFCSRRRTKVFGFSNVFTIFLQSLSRSRHPSIAVVLSGLDRDGAAALSAFRQSGGIVIVQAPESADRPDMPQAAMATGCVDYVLKPEAIAGQLRAIASTLCPGKHVRSDRPMRPRRARRIWKHVSVPAGGSALAKRVERFTAKCKQARVDAAKTRRLNRRLMEEQPEPLFVETTIRWS